MTKHGWYQFPTWRAYVSYSPFSEERWFFVPSLLTYPSCHESLQPVSPSLPWGPAAVLFFYWEKILSLPIVISVHLPEIGKKKEGRGLTQRLSVSISRALRGGRTAVCLSGQRDQTTIHRQVDAQHFNSLDLSQSPVVCVSEQWYIFYYRFIRNKMPCSNGVSPCCESRCWETKHTDPLCCESPGGGYSACSLCSFLQE